MPNYVGEKAIVAGPEIDQEIPVNLGKILQVHQRILVIAGKGEAALQRGADEALMVVGSRVEQVAEDFFFGPFVRAWTRAEVSALSSCSSSGLAWATVRPRSEAMGENGLVIQ